MIKKIINYLQNIFLAVTVLFIVSQVIMLIIKAFYTTMLLRYTLIPLWTYIVYFSLLVIIASTNEGDDES